MNTEGYYRRPLPPPLIPFSSPEGRKIFSEALALGGMEGYFTLAEQFHTQAEPAFCGLGTLVVVLNALAIDPGRIWKGLWRWYGEEFLDCCQPLSKIKEQGITFDELVCLARCNGAKVEPSHYYQSSLESFRQAIAKATSSPQGLHIIVSYSRQVLGQTGSGHFSPIGGYHARRDLVLLLDVARFKYPPHWVPLSLLWEALRPIDPVTGKSRGYILISKGTLPSQTFYQVALDLHQWVIVSPYFTDTLPKVLAKEKPDSLKAVVEVIFRHLPSALTSIITSENTVLNTVNHVQQREQELLAEIRSYPLFVIVQKILAAPYWNEATIVGHWLSRQKNLAELITILLLSCPQDIYKTLNVNLQQQIQELRELEKIPSLMQQEVARLREQMLALQDLLRGAVSSCER